MSLTAGLPLRHPAVWISALILLVGYAAILIEEIQKMAGALPPGSLRLWMSMVGLPIWTWMMLAMIGRPDLFIEERWSPTDWESSGRRHRLVQRIGYILQCVTLMGGSAAIWRWL